MRFLLVDSAKRSQELLSETLGNAGYALDIAGAIGELLTNVATVRYDLMIIDPALPDGDGLEAIRALRARRLSFPILIVTFRARIGDRVNGLDSGADDYLTKPFHAAELLAHVRALLRRPHELQPVTAQKGTVELDTSTQEVRCRGHILNLRPAERRLLALLMRRDGIVVLKSALENAPSQSGREKSTNAVEALVSRLRKALREVDSGVAIHTVRGIGYRLAAGDEQ